MMCHVLLVNAEGLLNTGEVTWMAAGKDIVYLLVEGTRGTRRIAGVTTFIDCMMLPISREHPQFTESRKVTKLLQ